MGEPPWWCQSPCRWNWRREWGGSLPSVCEFLQQKSKPLQEVSGMIITHSCSGVLVPTHTEFHQLHSALRSNWFYFKLCNGTECLPSGRENTYMQALNEYQDKSRRMYLYFGMEHNFLFVFFRLHHWTEFQNTFCGVCNIIYFALIFIFL